jgi:ABC-type multidrug transport system fused ATPase/permease subunit
MNQMCVGCWEWYCIRMDLVSTLVVASACGLCIYGRNHINPVLLALLLRYILTLQTYCIWTLYCYGNIEQQMVSVQRFVNLNDVPQEADEFSVNVDSAWPKTGVVEFRNATLKYRPTTDAVLKNLSFVVDPGTKIGVVGRTGAGKSTICISLSRIVELFDGSILIDGIDVSKIDLQKLREKVTVIP